MNCISILDRPCNGHLKAEPIVKTFKLAIKISQLGSLRVNKCTSG